MLALISFSKGMAEPSSLHLPEALTASWNLSSVPFFRNEALVNAHAMASLPVPELEKVLKVQTSMAEEVARYYADFSEEMCLPALFAYNGVAFRHIAPETFTREDLLFAQDHLRITSFLYGLLRPLDRIARYRIEGNVRLAVHGDVTMFDYWKPLLTDLLISAAKERGGVLLNLASGEMQRLFDWRKVLREVRVVTPDFLVRKSGRDSRPSVYAKMCRGEMVRFLIAGRRDGPDALKEFGWEGFAFEGERSSGEAARVLSFVKSV